MLRQVLIPATEHPPPFLDLTTHQAVYFFL